MICQHVKRLLARGWDVDVFCGSEGADLSWFPSLPVQVQPLGSARNIDILIATGWQTVEVVASMKARQRLYFIQSDERRFYPSGAHEIAAAHATYSVGWPAFTEARWIQRWLEAEFGHAAAYVPNGVDRDIFHRTPGLARRNGRFRVLLEGPISVPFKGMADAFAAVADLNCEVWCVSGGGEPKPGWRCDMFFEKVPMGRMRDIYSSCDVLLKMSRVEGFFGPPLEMMACGGVAVVAKVTGYDEYIRHEGNALVVESGAVADAARAVERLQHSAPLRAELQRGGAQTVEAWNWERSIDALEPVLMQAADVSR